MRNRRKRLLKKEERKKIKSKSNSDNFEEYTIKKVLMELPFAFIVILGFVTILLFAVLFFQNIINMFNS